MKMNSKIGLMLILMIIGCVSVCCAAEQQDTVVLKLTGDENVNLKIGETVRVELDENPTTGYMWTYKKTQNPHLIQEVGESEFIRDPHRLDAVGVGGTRIYRFEALQKGQATLTFELNRSWEKEKGTPPEEKYVVTISIEPY